MPRYTAFGLVIQSDFELPLVQEIQPDSWGDFIIRRETISDKMKTEAGMRHYSCLENGDILCTIPAIASYLIRDNEIVVDPIPSAPEEAVLLFLLGSAMGAALYRRNALLLHAMAVKVGNEALIISGASGIGKSSLAAAFIQEGYQILTDDVAVIRRAEGKFKIWPSYPQVKLWRENLKALGKNEKQLRPIYNRIEKYNISIENHFCTIALPIKALVTLKKCDDSSLRAMEFHKLSGSRAFSAVRHDGYRIQFIQQLASTRSHFSDCSHFANSVSIYELLRPHQGCAPSAIRDFCLNKWGKAEDTPCA